MPRITIPSNIQVPIKIFDYNFRFIYVDDNGNDIDFGDDIISAAMTRRSLKYGIGDFAISLLNNNGKYKSKINNATQIKVYAQHTSATPTNQIFYGKVDNPLFGLSADNRWIKTITGRDYPRLIDSDISKSFSNANASSAFKSIIDDNFSDLLTYNNISSDMISSITEDYLDSNGSNIFQDILKRAGFDGYIDFSNDVHTFKDGGKINATEKILYGHNLMPFDEFGKDYLSQINRIKLRGNNADDMQLIATRNDLALQSAAWIKSKIISEGSINDLSALSQRALSELDFGKIVTDTGLLTAANGLPTSNPGESIKCEAPYAGITGNYIMPEISHILTQDGSYVTICQIARPGFELGKILNNMNRAITTNIKNDNFMDFTIFNFTFENEDDIAALGSLRIKNNKLEILTGSQGTMTSDIKTLLQNAQKLEFKAKGTQLDLSYIKISTDGGQTFNDNASYNIEAFKGMSINIAIPGKNIYVETKLISDATYTNPQLERLMINVKF